jgi:formylglycine-generating enzyme required for sulfatase activity
MAPRFNNAVDDLSAPRSNKPLPLAPRLQSAVKAPMSRTERARQRKLRRNFLMFVGAQLLIAALAFVFVRDYMSGGSIRHTIVNAVGQLGNDSKQAKSDPDVAVQVAQSPAAAPSQDVATIQETPAAIEPPTAPTPETQVAAVPAEPQAEPIAEVPITKVEPEIVQQAEVPEVPALAEAAPEPEPQPVAQTATPPVEPQPAPVSQVEPQIEAQPVTPEQQPAVEEVVAAAVPVPDLSSQNNDPAATPEQKEGLTFRDCDLCPELVSVAPGQFLVGAGGQGIAQPSASATPQEVVVDKPFAIGRYEITFDDWERCVKDGACTTQPSDDGWGRGRRPIIHVSYNDITEQYLPWLSKISGHTYRLPTESEWELASQGGSKSSLSRIQEAGSKAQLACTYGNSSDVSAKTREAIWAGVGCNDGFVYTAPVGSLKSNSLGIYDMHGNVWEWVSDCWHATYETAEEKNSSNCKYHVLRGGSWASEFRFLPDGVWVGDAVAYRAAVRGWETSVKARNSIGFRVARSQP